MALENNKNKKISKFLLFKVFLRSFFIQAVWNFERFLGFGLTYAMLPVLRYLYPNIEKRKLIIQEYLSCFNTHPYLAAPIIGMLIREEERAANAGGDFSREKIQNLKIQIMGVLGALGDTFFWATLRPFTALAAVIFVFFLWDKNKFLALSGSLFFFFCFYNLFHLFIRFAGIFKGYQLRLQIFSVLKKIDLKKMVKFFTALGMIILGIGLGFLPFSSSLFNLGVPLGCGNPANFFSVLIAFIVISLLLSVVSPAKMILVLILFGELLVFMNFG